MATAFEKFDLSPTAFINPGDVIEPIDGFPKVCISTFSNDMIENFASRGGAKVIAHLYSANGSLPVYKISYGGKDIAFFLSRVGGPACVAGFEEIVAMGAEKFVLFGCCGILDDAAAGSNLIVPTAAVRDEGTSYHYAPPSRELAADQRATCILTACLDKLGFPYVKGKIWTTDAIYRETPDRIAERKKDGCIGVEMEYASMLAAAQFRNIPFLQFLYGADNLDCASWDPRDLEQYGMSNAEKYMKLALECAIAL
ncbi:nucleoside phosphorylase [uncultured Robinsoniella sp.]|uniref:nucleoside phosphorylase n=1 Tax=uncultured Robinsoniella sp. TaxID=904190 RepID=UPI00374F1574